MARPKSDDKRSAIVEAATRVIVKQGLSAPTAVIADEAGVANGTLFTYFETKTDLLNALYVELKTSMAMACMEGVTSKGESRAQFQLMWNNWVEWTLHNTDKRRALALLGVSDEISQTSRMAGHKIMAPVAVMLEKARAKGPLKSAPMAFVVAMMNSIADATMDFITQDPKNAEKHGAAGFEALWRVIT